MSLIQRVDNGDLLLPINGKSHQTREPRHLSCHGGKTKPTRMYLYAPARPRRAVRGAGVLPLQKVAGLDDGVQTGFDVAAEKIKKGGAFAAWTNR